MKKIDILFLLALAATTMLAQTPTANVANTPGRNGTDTVFVALSSSQAIANARAMVAQNPKSADGYVALGLALCHRGEEALEASLYGQAEDALNKALELAPNNFDAEKGRVCVMLGRHEFARALDAARVLNKRVPDDVMVYGLLADANEALGNYDQAETAAQWMLNLRPGNTPALVRAAGLREVFGDQEGAIDLLRIVLDATTPGDVERRAKVLTQIAHLNLEGGHLDAAETQLQQALASVPDDRGALNNMAELRLLQGRPEESVRLLRQSCKAAPGLETQYLLAEAMDSAGMRDEATKTFAEFETKAQAASSVAVNVNRELIFYYADHANKPAQALQIAEEQFKNRHDVYTLDAYAWALYKNGRFTDAKKQLDIALKVGVHDASIFYHAGEIELQLGNLVQAAHHFRAATEMHSFQSSQARAALAALPPGTDVER
jgi:tetratricopeptide (TPR) repeat protein